MVRINLLLLTIIMATGLAKAQSCVSYGERQVICSSGSCSDSFVVNTCIIGCVSGSCSPNGNSTSCCGTRIDYAQIFTDGGTCDGQNCGLARIRRAEMRAKKSGSVADAKSYAPPLHLPPRRVFIPNRCTHEFDIAYDWNFSVFEKEGI
jgi:hypothetical protein